MRGWALTRSRVGERSGQGGQFAGGLQRIAGRDDPPELVEPRRLSASRLTSRCPSCGGLNEPPNSPIRMPGRRAAGARARTAEFESAAEGRSRPGLARPAHPVFERGQLLDADRPARMHPAGGDADLGAEAELAAIGELGRGVVQQDGRIDLVEEALRRRRDLR